MVEADRSLIARIARRIARPIPSRTEMRARTKNPDWVQALRTLLRREIGPAWRVMEQRGKAKLDIRLEDGSRSYATLALPWEPASARAIQEAVERIAALVGQGQTLKAALASLNLSQNRAAPVAAKNKNSEILLAAWKSFGHYKVEMTGQIKPETWDKVYGRTEKRLKEVIDSPDAKTLLERAGTIWEPGSRGRQIALQHISSMLRWAIDEGKLPAGLWMPPTKIKVLVGQRIQKAELRTPLTDEQILRLIGSLKVDSNNIRDREAAHRWRFAFQLMATYGLRPIEIHYLRIENKGKQRLWCDYQKRSGGGTTKPRTLRALHPEWEDNWRLLERIKAEELLPPSGGGVADAARRYLARQPAWTAMAETGCTPYSFRHGWALRCHTQYPLISTRIAAEVMGHSPAVHSEVYGSWTDERVIDDSFAAGINGRVQNKTEKKMCS